MAKRGRKLSKKQTQDMYIAFIAAFMVLMLLAHYILDVATDKVSNTIREIVFTIKPLTDTYEKIIEIGIKPANLFTQLIKGVIGYVPGGEGTLYAGASMLGAFIIGTIGFIILAPFFGVPMPAAAIIGGIVSLISLIM